MKILKHPLSGRVCVVLSTLCFALMGHIVKRLDSVPFHQQVFFRSMSVLSVTLLILSSKKISPFGNNPKRLSLRGVTGASSLFLFFYTLKTLPYSLATTLQYLTPLFTIVAAHFFLNDKATLKQWIGICVAILALASMQLGEGLGNATGPSIPPFSVGMGILASLLAAASYANIRTLNTSENTNVIVFYLSFITLLIGTPYTLTHWVRPTPAQYRDLFFMGAISYVGQLLLTMGYQRGEASKMASLGLLNVVWAVFISEFLWQEHLGVGQLLAVGVIVLSAVLSQ